MNENYNYKNTRRVVLVTTDLCIALRRAILNTKIIAGRNWRIHYKNRIVIEGLTT
jgi:hypothetical protein